MSSSIINNKDKMEKIRKDSNPSMVDVDEMVAIFGNYEKPTNSDSQN
jgi:hypothetical protein